MNYIKFNLRKMEQQNKWYRIIYQQIYTQWRKEKVESFTWAAERRWRAKASSIAQ